MLRLAIILATARHYHWQLCQCSFNPGSINPLSFTNKVYFIWYQLLSRENDGTEREAQGVARDTSCTRKLFLAQWKSHFSGRSLFSETSACSLATLSGSLWHFVRHYMKFLLFFQTSQRGWPPCERLRRQTSAKTKTSPRLKIPFVDMT